ncbi:MAG: hypothetical protein RIC16_08965 [Rhodospirillales bacterium]
MGLFKSLAHGWKSIAAGAAIVMSALTATAFADFVGHGGMIRSIDISPETGKVLTGGFDFSTKLWLFDEQREISTYSFHDGPVNAVRFLSGGTRAVSVGADGRTVFWSLADEEPEASYEDHQGRAMALGVSTSGNLVVSGGWDGRMVVRRADASGDPIVIEAGVPIVAVAFNADEDVVIGGGRDGRLLAHRIDDGVRVAGVPAHDIGLTAIAPTPDGELLVSIGLDNTARIWRTRDMRLIKEFKADPAVKPVAVSVANDGKAAAITYIDGLLIHIEVPTAKILNGFKVDERPVFAVEISADGNFALTAGMDESGKVWHLASGDHIQVAGTEDPSIPRPWLETDHPGAILYRKCANCHALTASERQRAGPHFEGLFGRPAGSVEGYRYSTALLNTNVVWSPETVAELFRIGPDRFLPGTKMPVQQIPSDDALESLVEYMRTIVPGG